MLDLFQKGHPAGGAPSRVGLGEGVARGRPKGAEDVALAAPAIVDLLSGSSGMILVATIAWPGQVLALSGPISSRQTTTLPAGGAV